MKYIPVVLASFSVVMCFVLTYFLAFTELLVDRLQGQPRYITIAILLAYAAMRIYRMVKMIKKIRHELSE